jgi:hypothetical protein
MTQQFQSTVGWRTYLDPTNNPRVSRFLKKNGSVVFEQVVRNIRTAIDERHDKFVLIAHPNVSSVIVVSTIEYRELLAHCLEWFKSHENYEQCEDIIKLQSRLPNKINSIILN